MALYLQIVFGSNANLTLRDHNEGDIAYEIRNVQKSVRR